MTYGEYIETDEGLTLYDDIDLDEDTQAEILDWFRFRFLVNDEKFYYFFRRAASLSSGRYNQLLRIELTEFDPLVSKYLERQLVHTGNATTEGSHSDESSGNESGSTGETYGGSDTTTTTGGGTTANTGTETTSETRTPQLTKTTITDNDGSSSTTYGSSTSRTGTDTTEGENENETDETRSDDSKAGSKNAPQSISYEGADAGSLPDFDWQYLTVQQQNSTSGSTHTETDGSSKSTTTYNTTDAKTGTDATTTTVDESVTETESGTETTSGTRTPNLLETRSDNSTASTTYGKTVTGTTSSTSGGTSSGTSTETTSDETTDQEIYTGRDGLTPQDALDRARLYIMKSNAFEWLRYQLEPCFMAIYDV